jgi:hypothetical protein
VYAVHVQRIRHALIVPVLYHHAIALMNDQRRPGHNAVVRLGHDGQTRLQRPRSVALDQMERPRAPLHLWYCREGAVLAPDQTGFSRRRRRRGDCAP